MVGKVAKLKISVGALLFLLCKISFLWGGGLNPSKQVVTLVSRPTELDYLSRFAVPGGIGSALVVSAKEGILLAPAHLVQGAQWIDIVLPDGNQLGAKILAVDQLTGLAVLKTKSFGSERAYFRQTLPKVGEEVFLIGRPRFTVSLRQSYVSECPVRVISKGITLASFFAVEASLKGLGSVPVFDAQGRVVGFAFNLPNLSSGRELKILPAYLMELVAKKALREKKIVWPWLGLEGLGLNPSLAETIKVPAAEGVLVTRIYPGSPAARAGIRGPRKMLSLGNLLWPVGGDIITSFEGKKVVSQAQLERLIFEATPGKLIELGLWRGKRFLKVKVYLGRRSFIQP